MAARICDLVLVAQWALLKVWGIGVFNGFTLGFSESEIEIGYFIYIYTMLM